MKTFEERGAEENKAFEAWVDSTGVRVEHNVLECMRAAWNVRAGIHWIEQDSRPTNGS